MIEPCHRKQALFHACQRCCHEHQLSFILLAYVMSIVVLLPYVNSKTDFAVVSGVMIAKWICCAGHQSKKLLQVGSKEQTVRA